MRQIGDRIAMLVNLVENIVSEQLDDVSIPSFRPSRITGESNDKSMSLGPMNGKGKPVTTHSGRSLINPNLHSSRTSRAFSSSLSSSFSNLSVALQIF
jgi:hypothetical protein